MALSAEQLRFLAARLLVGSDAKAAEQAGVSVGSAYRWKCEDSEFRQAYEETFSEGVKIAKAYTARLLGLMARNYELALDATKPILVKVALVGADGKLEATDEQQVVTVPDWKTRLAANEAVGKIHGLFINRTEVSGRDGKPIEVRQTPAMDLSNLTDQELDDLERLLRKAAPKGDRPEPSLVGAES